jgi:hypothetical protein
LSGIHVSTGYLRPNGSGRIDIDGRHNGNSFSQSAAWHGNAVTYGCRWLVPISYTDCIGNCIGSCAHSGGSAANRS